ncbi:MULTISPECIES: efflux RND transporter permease subunit [Brucella/Ochrobactrum group]|uniref:Acriflavin resistance protein n=1 Tax=Brucella anthropi (strain ATCC 49188 / DSM 6882 / CCUG 24695 / JCM 21032 / LMG 3331 / NBRC 15819 / NCTC 12168 / Alc 37) TaxID=439375 RepID=A6WYW6_BRUA4|nr:efflux RND transporter permease subunit [Brucella anthropi]MCQ9145909.1 efflux RND transporter permease subunit [Ochrobactrum sp. BTU2]ABS14170.1 acriflavin resistance protein [Brucella anthropi ATCC 49188]AIK45137.1 acrB/AcrD/AcrF family protein [Brucella anthropi]KAB2732885.1 efflux RND transporter permease subunit [Brucella anthropi]KAB2753279.1 efflux RND transporter permease subunit [Brucella anthropi]
MKKGFNLSDWALNHRSLVWYFMLVFLVAGLISYLDLGREEDPDFTVKTMVVQANWPGASVDETLNQVTDRLEKKLEELDTLDYTRSITTAGKSVVFVFLKDTTRAEQVKKSWTEVRHFLNDIQNTLPQGVLGPYFNDQFGDVYGNVYAFTSDGLSMRQLRDYAESTRTKILTLPNAGKVELIGAQDEAIYLEFSTRQIAALGLDQQAILQALQDQNAITPSGVVEAGPERISVRVSGQFNSEADLRAVNLRVNDRFFRLSDVATITRGYVDPPASIFRVNGHDAIGLGIGMKPNGNLLEFGAALDKMMSQVTAELPVGVKVFKVADQPEVVKDAVSGFTEALFEAVIIVLAVSFVSLGVRAGFVVSLSIPLVLAITFLAMSLMDISLQRVSLGALIIALGLLVDDAMIAVEMMVARLEHGDPINKAATYVYSHTAFPMLTGTLVTIAGFIPIGLNNSQAGEYTFTLFVVIAVSLLVSWIVAVLFAPLLGVTFLPKKMKAHEEKHSRLFQIFSQVLLASMRHKWITIITTIALFLVSVFGMGFIERQFFPESDRPELVLDWTLPQNSSITDTKAQMEKFEATMLKDNPDVDHWSTYIGEGAIRFILSFDVQPANPYFGQMVVVAKDLEARDRLKQKFNEVLRKDYVGTDVYVKYLELGPPVGRPVQYRISGPDVQKLRGVAQDFAGILSSDKRLGVVSYNWNEPGRVIRVDVMQDKARKLGISSKDIATTLNGVVGGITITQVRDSIYLIDVIVRAQKHERDSIDTLQSLQIATGNGTSVPLAAIANFRYELEQPVVYRRSRIPTITVAAGIIDKTMPDTIVKDLAPAIKTFADKLPSGYQIQIAGTVEESGKSQGPIAAVVPLMLFVMATILMIQLQSFQRLFLVVAVAPLGLIGVVAALLPSGKPLGFVAILGVLALVGILIRNSVILIVQVEEHITEGMHPWDAVTQASQHRMRPIALTAAAASLALIPIAREVFWGPMAYAMMGGIIAGTAITLLFLPALYVAWFRIKEPEHGADGPPAEAHPAPQSH